MSDERVTPETPEAVRYELDQMHRSHEPGGPNGVLASIRVSQLLGDVAAKLVIGRDKRLREAGKGAISDADIQMLAEAAADLDAMTLKRIGSDG